MKKFAGKWAWLNIAINRVGPKRVVKANANSCFDCYNFCLENFWQTETKNLVRKLSHRSLCCWIIQFLFADLSSIYPFKSVTIRPISFNSPRFILSRFKLTNPMFLWTDLRSSWVLFNRTTVPSFSIISEMAPVYSVLCSQFPKWKTDYDSVKSSHYIDYWSLKLKLPGLLQ